MPRLGATRTGVLVSLIGLAMLASPVHADSQIAVSTFEDERPEQPGTTVATRHCAGRHARVQRRRPTVVEYHFTIDPGTYTQTPQFVFEPRFGR